jgi:hypothetical protein
MNAKAQVVRRNAHRTQKSQRSRGPLQFAGAWLSLKKTCNFLPSTREHRKLIVASRIEKFVSGPLASLQVRRSLIQMSVRCISSVRFPLRPLGSGAVSRMCSARRHLWSPSLLRKLTLTRTAVGTEPVWSCIQTWPVFPPLARRSMSTNRPASQSNAGASPDDVAIEASTTTTTATSNVQKPTSSMAKPNARANTKAHEDEVDDELLYKMLVLSLGATVGLYVSNEPWESAVFGMVAIGLMLWIRPYGMWFCLLYCIASTMRAASR